MELLVDACETAFQKRDGWLQELEAAVQQTNPSDSCNSWHDLHEKAKTCIRANGSPTTLEALIQSWLYVCKHRCKGEGCCEYGEERYSCGYYAGRYCDAHWQTSGFRDAGDRIDYLDAGEHETEVEAY